MIATSDRALLALRAAAGNRPDDDVVLVEVATLLAACRALEDHAHCDNDGDEALANLEKEHEAEMARIVGAARDLIVAVEKLMQNAESIDAALAGLKGMV